MRLKKNRLQTCYHRPAQNKKDGEGNSYVEYGSPHSLDAEVWPGGGKLQAEIYGQRLSYIRNCRIEGKYAIVGEPNGHIFYALDGGPELKEGDGFCLYVPGSHEPDYKIISIKPYRFLTLELERL